MENCRKKEENELRKGGWREVSTTSSMRRREGETKGNEKLMEI